MVREGGGRSDHLPMYYAQLGGTEGKIYWEGVHVGVLVIFLRLAGGRYTFPPPPPPPSLTIFLSIRRECGRRGEDYWECTCGSTLVSDVIPVVRLVYSVWGGLILSREWGRNYSNCTE
jgi:hypothetical protein